MASFATDVWESIFTPGPTPPLLIATNVTFGALQLVLLLLLLGTYSIHFVILSFLCAGLWWSINWFAAELQVQKAREAAEKRRAERREKERDSSDTEVESTTGPLRRDEARVDVEPVEQVGELKRTTAAGTGTGTTSSVSTEDEWEKVSESEQDKDK